LLAQVTIGSAGEHFTSCEQRFKRVADVRYGSTFERVLYGEFKGGNPEVHIAGFELLEGLLVLGQNDKLEAACEKLLDYGGIEECAVSFVTGEDGIVKHDEAGLLMDGACEEQRQAEAVQLRLSRSAIFDGAMLGMIDGQLWRCRYGFSRHGQIYRDGQHRGYDR
jgi:hypothetical protein